MSDSRVEPAGTGQRPHWRKERRRAGHPSLRKFSRCGAALSFLAFSASCGDLTAGGAADAEVVVVGDGSSAAPASSAGPPRTAAGTDAPAGSIHLLEELVGHPYEGTVQLRLRVLLIGSDQVPISISGGDRLVEVDVRGEMPQSLGSFRVSPGQYAGVRVVFTEVTAGLTAGLGSLPPLGGGAVQVDLSPSDPVSVESMSSFLLDDRGHLAVTVDLRAPEWIALVAGLPPALRIVSAADFAQRVHLVVDPR